MNRVADLFDKISDRMERVCGHWSSIFVFTTAFVVGMLAIGVDVTNIAVSYVTAGLLFLGMGRSRRDSKAVQAKLDDLLVRIKEADSDLAGLEDKQESEIDALKQRHAIE
jgi:low affinity Fe/Cu permease